MQHPRRWRRRIILGALAGALIVFVWIRREAHIASTPAGVEANAERKTQNAELRNPVSNFSPSVPSVPTVASEGGVAHDVVATEPSEPVRDAESDSLPPDGSSSFSVHRSAFLPIPFVSQAPFRVWDLPYKEYCEEASVLTVHYWKQGRTPPAADQIDRDLKDIQVWEEANIGRWEDTTAEEAARILREKFGYASTRVTRDVSVDDIKRALDAKHPVIVPAAGRELSSPYYKPPGPLYHMLVVIGYDDRTSEFITNDVGTNTKGAGFRFTYDDLYGAMGDWSHERQEPDTSQKVMIVVE